MMNPAEHRVYRVVEDKDTTRTEFLQQQRFDFAIIRTGDEGVIGKVLIAHLRFMVDELETDFVDCQVRLAAADVSDLDVVVAHLCDVGLVVFPYLADRGADEERLLGFVLGVCREIVDGFGSRIHRVLGGHDVSLNWRFCKWGRYMVVTCYILEVDPRGRSSMPEPSNPGSFWSDTSVLHLS